MTCKLLLLFKKKYICVWKPLTWFFLRMEQLAQDSPSSKSLAEVFQGRAISLPAQELRAWSLSGKFVYNIHTVHHSALLSEVQACHLDPFSVYWHIAFSKNPQYSLLICPSRIFRHCINSLAKTPVFPIILHLSTNLAFTLSLSSFACHLTISHKHISPVSLTLVVSVLSTQTALHVGAQLFLYPCCFSHYKGCHISLSS